MEFECSKSPWNIGSHPCNDQSKYTVRSDSNTVIAHVSQPSDNEQRARADADLRLIAAAPELLEALIEIRKLVAHHDKADLAIAKALGQQ